MSAADFEPAKAKCSLMARHSGGSFAAYGDANFVAGATVGNAIGETARTQRDFNDCMAASGWKIADQPSAATQANQPMAASQPAAERLNALAADLKSCTAIIRAKPTYEPLLPHLVDLNTGRFTVTQLTDDRRPTPAESRLIAPYRDETNSCRAKFLNELSAVSPASVAIFSQVISKNDDVEAQLAKRQLTWGDAATKLKQIMEAGQAQLRATQN